MKTLSFWKKSMYSALIFFGTLVALSVGYSAWNAAMSKVNSGNPLSATSWNALVDNIADLDSRWSRSGGNIVFTGGNVGIGTTTIPGTKLEINGDLSLQYLGWLKLRASGAGLWNVLGTTDAGTVALRTIDNGATAKVQIQSWNGIPVTTFQNDGNVGIGTTSLAWWEKLAVASNGARISFGDSQAGNPTITWQGGGLWLNSTNGVHVGNSVGGYGPITANVFNTASDRRLKGDITPLSGSLGKILSLSGYSFTWKQNKTQDIGLIAQEVEKVFPSLVHTDKNTTIKSVEYANLVAPLIEAVKELKKENDSLKARLDRLEQK